MTSINRKLNLVVPVERADGSLVYVHSIPISEHVFDKYYEPIAMAFSKIYAGGLGLMAGPRVAAKVIKDVAVKGDNWDGPEGVEQGLFGEIRRLTSVIANGPNGWEPVAFEDAVKQGLVEAEDASEVENALAFFTVASSMHKRREIEGVLTVVSRIWGAQPTSSTPTEYASSLKTSTAIVASGEKATQ